MQIWELKRGSASFTPPSMVVYQHMFVFYISTWTNMDADLFRYSSLFCQTCQSSDKGGSSGHVANDPWQLTSVDKPFQGVWCPSSHVSLPGPTNAPMTKLCSPKMPQCGLHVSQQNCNILQRAPRSTSRSSFNDHETNFPVKNEADKIRHASVTAFDCRVKRNMAELSTIMTIDLVVLFQSTLQGLTLFRCFFN